MRALVCRACRGACGGSAPALPHQIQQRAARGDLVHRQRAGNTFNAGCELAIKAGPGLPGCHICWMTSCHIPVLMYSQGSFCASLATPFSGVQANAQALHVICPSVLGVWCADTGPWLRTGPPGSMVVSVGSAMEESAFASVRVRRYGNLCVTFTPDLKILAYDFNVITIDHSFPHAPVCYEMRALEQVSYPHAPLQAASASSTHAPFRRRLPPSMPYDRLAHMCTACLAFFQWPACMVAQTRRHMQLRCSHILMSCEVCRWWSSSRSCWMRPAAAAATCERPPLRRCSTARRLCSSSGGTLRARHALCRVSSTKMAAQASSRAL